MFRCPKYMLDFVRKLMVYDGNLDLLSDYIVVGLGGGYDILPQLLEDVRDVSGYARTIKTYTGFLRNLKVSTIVICGGPSYAEWAVALAYMKHAKALIGVGWCGALQEYMEIGDAITPIATMRDEDTTLHYADLRFPAVADPNLLHIAMDVLNTRLEKLKAKLWLGITVSTSAMLAEPPERVRLWRDHRALCVDEETSTIYTLSYLANIPALTLLTVSDNVILGKDSGFKTKLSEHVDTVFQELAKGALEVLTKFGETNSGSV